MADAKLSALTELAAAPATGDELYIRDISEAASAESKRITIVNLFTTPTLATPTLTTPDIGVANGTSLSLSGNLDMESTGTILNVGGAGNDWTANGLRVDTSNQGGDNTIVVDNSNNDNTSSHAKLRVEVGGSSGGDPLVHFSITAVDSWSVGVDNTVSDQMVMCRGTALGTNDRLRLQIGTGVLSVDGDGGGSDDPVSLFDDYDDAIELRRFAYSFPGAVPLGLITERQRSINRHRLIEMGVAEWAEQEEGADHLMYRIQPMIRLLAGGVYQNRAYIESLERRIKLGGIRTCLMQTATLILKKCMITGMRRKQQQQP